MGQLGFLEITEHIGVCQRHHRQQFRARINVGANPQRTLTDHAVDGRHNAGIRQIQLRPLQACLGMLQTAFGTVNLRAENIHLLARSSQRRV
ncbi:hypothetical protein D3C72_1947460 [compost metagenome]